MTENISASAIRRQALFWLGALAFLVLFLWVFSDILLPFVAGMALAYFLDPVADRLERMGLSRLAATLVILLAFILTFLLALMIVVPVLASQLAEFVVRIPSYFSRLQAWIANVDSSWIQQRLGVDPTALRESVQKLLEQSAGFLTTILQSLWSSGRAILDIISLFVVTPVVAFYLLLDWDRMVARLDSWIPRDHVRSVRRIGNDINSSVAGFVRGQGTVCLILGTFYAIGLTVAGLNFGLLIGMFAGLISFIPYVGSLIGLVLSLGVAVAQFWPDWTMLAVIAAIFFGGQFLEGNFLQPKLVGESVNLHPVWLMFALFAFGSLYGFVGMLVAVPAAAIIGVLVRFALERYLNSQLYEGSASRDDTG